MKRKTVRVPIDTDNKCFATFVCYQPFIRKHATLSDLLMRSQSIRLSHAQVNGVS